MIKKVKKYQKILTIKNQSDIIKKIHSYKKERKNETIKKVGVEPCH